MRPATLVRLALAGTRTDVLRVALTAVSAALATLAVLAALTVLAIRKPPGDAYAQSEQYANALLREPGLRGGTALAFVLLTIPVLALAGQCSRLGAPARDRRLSGFRLAGATPGQAVAIAVAETAIASFAGALVGFGVYLTLRVLLHDPDARGLLPLPTDVLPSAPALAATVLGLPMLAAAAAALQLRKVTLGPFGVVRRVSRDHGPRPWPGVLIVAGVLMFGGLAPFSRWAERREITLPEAAVTVLLFGGEWLAALGVVLGTGWISYTAGRLLHRYGGQPSALLAARRLLADPWTGSRTFAALLVCVLFGAGASGVRAMILADLARQEVNRRGAPAEGGAYVPEPDDFYASTLDLVDLAVYVALVIAAGGMLVAVAEGIVARRRAYASLVAAGVPRGVLARSILWQSLAPAVPGVALALATGATLTRGISGGTGGDGVVRAVPVPWAHLAAYGGLALAAVLVTVGAGLLFLRSSTAPDELRTT